MTIKIGFTVEDNENKTNAYTSAIQQKQATTRKSVVQVYFAAINKSTLFTFANNGKDTGSFTL